MIERPRVSSLGREKPGLLPGVVGGGSGGGWSFQRTGLPGDSVSESDMEILCFK